MRTELNSLIPENGKTLRVAVIGLGKVSLTDHIPAVLACENTALDSICDSNQGLVASLEERYQVTGFRSVSELIKLKKPDAAIVAVPHNQYRAVLQELVDAGVSCLKEKPYATNRVEAAHIKAMITGAGVHLQITSPRRYDNLYKKAEYLIEKIGRPVYFRMEYARNIPDLSVGWRSSRSSAGGGCLMDMGYHVVDLALWYFGLPSTVSARTTGRNRDGQAYDVEDTCSLRLGYDHGGQPDTRLYGELFISRISPKKLDRILIIGTKGALEVDGAQLNRVDSDGVLVETFARTGGNNESARHQVEEFARWLIHGIEPNVPRFNDHLNHLAVINAAYESNELHQQEVSISK